MTRQFPTLILLCSSTLGIAACNDEPAPRAAPSPAAEEASIPAAAPPEPTPAQVAPSSLPPPVVVIPSDAIGGSPITNLDDAYERGSAGLRKYCEDHDIPCESFYAKDTIQEGDAWILQFFGSPRNQGMYLTVRVFPDGHAEVER